jgi:hypothetical protein
MHAVIIVHLSIGIGLWVSILARATAERVAERLHEAILAQIEARAEKLGYASEPKKRVAEVQAILATAERMEAFRLSPRKVDEARKPSVQTFHGYEVLREVSVTNAAVRKELALFLSKALHWNVLRRALCFNPRHGLRVVHKQETLELVICFECSRIDVYEGTKLAETLTVVAKRHDVVDQIFRRADKSAEGRSP